MDHTTSGKCFRRLLVAGLWIVALDFATLPGASAGDFDLSIEQLTSGEKHHFFGYIGQCRTIPWNATGQYILGLEIDRIDRMPKPDEAATIILIDTHDNNRLLRVDKSRAWNPQQGTMFYWNPLKPETQFFFNDRDVETGKVFTVIYDIEKKKRVREFRYEDTPIGNAGVAYDGSAWLGLNYGRLARLRLSSLRDPPAHSPAFSTAHLDSYASSSLRHECPLRMSFQQNRTP